MRNERTAEIRCRAISWLQLRYRLLNKIETACFTVALWRQSLRGKFVACIRNKKKKIKFVWEISSRTVDYRGNELRLLLSGNNGLKNRNSSFNFTERAAKKKKTKQNTKLPRTNYEYRGRSSLETWRILDYTGCLLATLG